MAEDLQSLLAKIQEQGLDKANAERAAIIKKAEQEAAEITAKAKAAADAMRRAAEEECASLTKRAESAVKQAARDIVLKLNVELKERLNAILQENTANAMTPELMGRIINEMAAAYIKDGKQEAKLEVLVSPKSLEEMNAALKGSLKDSFVKQPTLFADMELGGGLKVSVSGNDVFYDFSDDAITDIVAAYIGPRLAAIVKAE
ncbi:MAG: hypothetical protein ACI4OV_00345 [Victivallaceae bacterium]